MSYTETTNNSSVESINPNNRNNLNNENAQANINNRSAITTAPINTTIAPITKPNRTAYYIIIVIIVILVIVLIVLIYLYFAFPIIDTAFLSVSSLDSTTVDAPAGTALVTSTITSGIDRLPPASITVYTATPTQGDILLQIAPSPLYVRGSLIKVGNLLNQPGTQYNIIVQSLPGVTINLATTVTSNIVRPNSWAALIATSTNVFTLINGGSVDRVNIRTQAGVNAIRKVYDPLGIPYRYFFEGVYYASNGTRGTYQAPVNIVTPPGGQTVYQYTDENGVFQSLINPRSATGDPFLTGGTVGSLPIGLISIFTTVSYLIPGDPINNWLKDVGNKLQGIVDNAKREKPLQPTTRGNNTYLIIAAIDLVFIFVLGGVLYMLR